ncbi:MAG: cysteine-rich CWC family protein [Burkholderiaceae bacterium]|nr:cysteine-rich CWC family protein [Burkholderiaceae bacterium]
MSDCVRCGRAFGCGMIDGDATTPCWCTALPPLPAAFVGRDAATCYCPACLAQLLAAVQRDAGKT